MLSNVYSLYIFICLLFLQRVIQRRRRGGKGHNILGDTVPPGADFQNGLLKLRGGASYHRRTARSCGSERILVTLRTYVCAV